MHKIYSISQDIKEKTAQITDRVSQTDQDPQKIIIQQEEEVSSIP